MRYGDAISDWPQTPDAANLPPAWTPLTALQDHYELERGRLSRGNVERAPGQRSHEIVNRVGMGCRQQGKPSLRGLKNAADRRSP